MKIRGRRTISPGRTVSARPAIAGVTANGARATITGSTRYRRTAASATSTTRATNTARAAATAITTGFARITSQNTDETSFTDAAITAGTGRAADAALPTDRVCARQSRGTALSATRPTDTALTAGTTITARGAIGARIPGIGTIGTRLTDSTGTTLAARTGGATSAAITISTRRTRIARRAATGTRHTARATLTAGTTIAAGLAYATISAGNHTIRPGITS